MFYTRQSIIQFRCYQRWFCRGFRIFPNPKPLKPLLSGIPIEVNDDLNAYLDNVSNRKALKRFSDNSVKAWFRSRGYEKK